MVKRKKMKWQVGVGGSAVEPWYILHTVFCVPEATKDEIKASCMLACGHIMSTTLISTEPQIIKR